MDKARGRNSAKKAELGANGTAHGKMTLEKTENYNNDGFINHSRMLRHAFKAHHLKHPDFKTDALEVQAEVRQTVGSAPSKALESRAWDVIKKDLPLLMEKPNFQWATDPTMILRTKLRSGLTQERVDDASQDIKAAREGRDALILRLLSQLSAHWVSKLPAGWQNL
jgi:hypothetical protein